MALRANNDAHSTDEEYFVDEEFQALARNLAEPRPRCSLRQSVRIYKYITRISRDNTIEANIWVSSLGSIFFQSPWGNSGWHGRFSTSPCGLQLTMLFNCRGDEDRLRSTCVLRESENRWTGYDYASRHITLIFLETKRFCDTCQAWHVITEFCDDLTQAWDVITEVR